MLFTAGRADKRVQRKHSDGKSPIAKLSDCYYGTLGPKTRCENVLLCSLFTARSPSLYTQHTQRDNKCVLTCWGVFLALCAMHEKSHRTPCLGGKWQQVWNMDTNLFTYCIFCEMMFMFSDPHSHSLRRYNQLFLTVCSSHLHTCSLLQWIVDTF